MKGLRPRPSRSLALGVVALLLLALLTFEIAQIAVAAVQVRHDAEAVLSIATELASDPTDSGALRALAPAADAAAASLETLRSELRPLGPALRLLRPLPPDAGWPADLPDALDAAVPLARAGAVAARTISTARGPLVAEQSRLTQFIVAASMLGEKAPELRRALDEAAPPLERLRGRELGGPLRQIAGPVTRGAELMPRAREAVDLLPLIGPALGMESERTYLLLGQNNHEIRASGGFIGSSGVVTVRDGAVRTLAYGTSYEWDYATPVPPAPGPLARYMGLGSWHLRDSNWWPDFPASAAQVELAWRRAGGPSIDGVIAFDTTAVDALLKALGPTDVEGYGRVAGDNFDRLAAEQLYSPGAQASGAVFLQARNLFLGAVGRALVNRLLRASPVELFPLADDLLALLETKHILLAFKDQRLVQTIHRRGWDGAVDPLSEDSLLAVDTSVSYGDSYSFVATKTYLTIEVGADGRRIHDLVLQYSNQYPRGLPLWMPSMMVGGATFDPTVGRINETIGFWGNWLRIYLPPGARGIEADGLQDPAPVQPELGRTVVAGYLPLMPGNDRTVRIRYVTEADDAAGPESYRLFLQKQPGVECRPISIGVTWPDGATADYEGCPTGDRWVELARPSR